jgi:BirA family transcriptional regulator, biotin operon repressor / biotin---[acetyl-CoA-carboxylase] ligase
LRYEVLKKLKEAGGFISGEHLGEGITRAAMWKHIKAMQSDGAQIEGVTGKGYRLISPPDVPRSEYVRAYMKADAHVFYKDSTTSTNEDAKRAAHDPELKKAVFIVSEQTAGKGRKGRQWVSPPGGLYMTFLVRPDIEPASVPGITIMAAVTLCGAIEGTANVKVGIKWPNDVQLGGKKLAGILTESMMGMDGVEFAVCGIGINTKYCFEGDLAHTACAVKANRTLLAAAAADAFFEGYDKFLRDGVAAFMDSFRERGVLSGEVDITTPAGIETGILLGYDDEGAILLDCAGETKRFIAGEASLRGGEANV